MLLRDIEPFVRVANQFTLDRNMQRDVFHKLKAQDCRLFYIVSGGGKMYVEEAEYPLSAGCIVLFQSNTEYMWRPYPEGISNITVNFDYTQAHAARRKSFHPVHVDVFDEATVLEQIVFEDAVQLNKPLFFSGLGRYESHLRLLATECYLGGRYSDALLSSLLKSLLISLVRETELSQPNNAERDTVERTVAYIQKNYAKDIKNTDIADAMGFHAVYLNRVFKRQTGTTLHAFLRTYRLTVAANLLQTSSLSVAEVAVRAGFGDAAHFTKTFKQATGKAPSQYKRRLL